MPFPTMVVPKSADRLFSPCAQGLRAVRTTVPARLPASCAAVDRTECVLPPRLIARAIGEFNISMRLTGPCLQVRPYARSWLPARICVRRTGR